MAVRVLTEAQFFDPQRGCFMVKPRRTKKRLRGHNIYYDKPQEDRGGARQGPHSVEFIVLGVDRGEAYA